MTSFIDRNRTEPAADAFLTALRTGIFPAETPFLSDDFLFWDNCRNAGLRRADTIRYAAQLAEKFRGSRYHDIRRLPTPTGLIQQNLMNFDSDQGHVADIPMMVILSFRDDRIARCDLYRDATGLPDVPWPEDVQIAAPVVDLATSAQHAEWAQDADLAVVKSYNDAWMARDLQGMKDRTADDHIQWHSHIRKDFSRTEEFAMLEEAIKVMQIRFHHILLYPVEGGAAQQCLGDIDLSNGATARDIPFGMVYRVRNGKIYRCDEYVDGLSLPQLDFIPAA